MTTVACAVLAAGSGTRMGRPKAEIEVAGERLIDRAVRVAREAGCDPVIAVVRHGTAVTGALAVVNPDPARGQRSSLALAVKAAGNAEALAVVLVDTPGIGVEAIAAVRGAWRPGRIVVAGYATARGHRRGHPTVMSPELWTHALELAAPDEGAKALIAARPDLVDVVDTLGDPTDLDTPADLERWQTGP